MAVKKQYAQFREILQGAICDMPQKEFAKKAGLSDTHLNRLINNPEIAQPSKETLQKILLAAPLTNAHDLFLSCDYESIPSISSIFKGYSFEEVSSIVANSLLDGISLLKDEQPVWDSIPELLRAYLDRFGWMMKDISKNEILENKDSNHNGINVVQLKAHWIYYTSISSYLLCETNFLIYGYQLLDSRFLLTDVAIDGLSLFRASHTEGVEDYLFQEGMDIRSLPNLTFSSKNKELKSPKLSRLFDILSGKNNTNLHDVEFGIGVNYEGMPNNFVEYVLKNKELLRDTPNTNEMIEELECLENPSVADVENLLMNYYSSDSDVRGVIAMMIDILNAKANSLTFPFTIKYVISDCDNLTDCLIVEEEQWITYGKFDKERYASIKEHFQNLVSELGYGQVLEVLTYSDFPIEIHEFGNYTDDIEC